MRTVVLAALLAAGCGRLGFDSTTAATGDARADGVPSDSVARVPADVLRYFPFDDDPTDGVDNLAPAGSPVRCFATCPTQVAGMRGGAYHFNGTSDVIIEEDSADLRVPRGSVAMWAKLDSLPPLDRSYQLAGHMAGTNTDNTWELFLANFSGDGAPLLYVGGDGAGNGLYATAPMPPLDTWFHIVMTWDASTRIYVDGALVMETALIDTVYDQHPITVGADFNASGYDAFAPGSIDEVVLMGRALTDQEIHDLASP